MSDLYAAKMQRGFTLVEMMIAILVFTVGLLSLLSAILFGLRMRFDSRLSSAALKLSQQVMEQLKSRSPDDPLLSHPGNPLALDGTIDFDTSPDGLASTTTLLQLNKTYNSQLAFETRCNISTTGNERIITVATRKVDKTTQQFHPVNLKMALPSP